MDEEGYACSYKRPDMYELFLMRPGTIKIERFPGFASVEEIQEELTTLPYLIHFVRGDAFYRERHERMLRAKKTKKISSSLLSERDDEPEQHIFPFS